MSTTSLTVMPVQDKLALARELSAADLLPAQYRQRPANLLYAIEFAEALGLHPVAAVTGIHVIEGKPTASAQLIGGLVRNAGHKLRVKFDRETMTATATVIRSDDPDFEFRSVWTLDRAKAAGLTNKGVWRQYPDAMLKARAITEVARDACPEVLYGVAYTPEELDADDVSDGWAVATAPPAGMVSRSDAKRRVVDAAGGSVECARRVWGDITDEWIPEARVAELEVAARDCADCQTSADDDVVDAEVVDDPGSTLIDERLMRRVHAVARDHDLDHDDIKAIVKATWALDSTKQLTVAQATELISAVEAGEYDDEVPM